MKRENSCKSKPNPAAASSLRGVDGATFSGAKALPAGSLPAGFPQAKASRAESPRAETLSDKPVHAEVLQSAGEVVARGGSRAAKLASPVVLSAPILKIATFHSSSLGSLVASLPALMALRDSFPGARIESFARAPLLPLLDCFAGVDEAHARPSGGISSQAALMARLHGGNYDLALSFSQGSNALLLLWATGAPTRAGFVPSHMDALLTHKIPKSGALRAIHGLELVRGIGATPRGERARDFLKISPETTRNARELLARNGIGNNYLLVAAEARKSEAPKSLKNAEHPDFNAALATLAARFPLVLVGLKSQNVLKRSLGETAFPVADLGGQTDVLTLAALCEGSRGAFGVGNGVLQLARLYEKPALVPRAGDEENVLAIFGL